MTFISYIDYTTSEFSDVDATRHGTWSLNRNQSADQGFAFAHKISSVPIALSELHQIATNFPIVFRKLGDKITPEALLRVGPAEHAHVGADGRWLATYVPAALRLYPFATNVQSPNAPLCVHDRSDKLNATPIGARLFDATGAPSENFERIQQFADAFHKSAMLASELATRLKASALLRSAHSIPALQTLPEDLYLVGSRDVFARLKLGSVLSLNQSGATELFWAHITSIQAFRHLVRQHNARKHASEQTPPPIPSQASSERREQSFLDALADAFEASNDQEN